MDKPSVGRIVHYQSYGTPGGEYQPLPRAAVITQVQSEEAGIVALCVLNPAGIFFDLSCSYNADGKPGTWRWPPRI